MSDPFDLDDVPDFDPDKFVCTDPLHNARDGCPNPDCFKHDPQRPEWAPWLAAWDAIVNPILAELDDD